MVAAVRQRRIGLTGGIASGKSTVARLLSERFALPVLDADTYARAALAPGSPLTQAVLRRYGERILPKPSDRTPGSGSTAGPRPPEGQDGPDGPAESTPPAPTDAAPAIDRAALGRIVFADPAERRWLEERIHPLVRRRFAEELERLSDAPVVVLMIPLLFEAGLEGLCDEIWVVSCDEEEQRRRLMARDQLTAAEAESRIAAQWPLARKRQLADVLIDNSGDEQHLIDQLETAL